MRFDGRCHCGNVEVTFETSLRPEALPLRECGCTFCRRHGAVAVTDPAGSLEVRVRDPGEMSRYRFGLRTAEFLICRTCGVYVAAVSTIEGATVASLNANVLDARAALTQRPAPVDYEGESAAERLSRRRRAWTPAAVPDLPR